MENSEILVELIKENLEEIRHNTDHRKEVTQFIFLIGSGIAVASTTTIIELSRGQIVALGILAIIIGIFGAIFTRKLHERQLWYSGRVAKLYEALDKKQAGLGITELYSLHQKEHSEKYQLLSKFRTNVLWMIINLMVSLLGVGLLFMDRS